MKRVMLPVVVTCSLIGLVVGVLLAFQHRTTSVRAQQTQKITTETVPTILPVPMAPATNVPPQIHASTTDGTLRVREPIAQIGEHAIRVPVLMYHYIRPLNDTNMSRTGQLLSVSPEHFEAEMQRLVAAGFHGITPDQLHAAVMDGASLPDKPILITFDDGYKDQYEYAFPVLKRLKMPATFFVITTYSHYGEYMTDAMLREMDASGIATIASHTQHHVALATVSDVVRRAEIAGAKSDLENLLGHAVTSIAYPYGSFDAHVKRVTAEVGYTMAFSTLIGMNHVPSSLYELRRVRVHDRDSVLELLEQLKVNTHETTI